MKRCVILASGALILLFIPAVCRSSEESRKTMLEKRVAELLASSNVNRRPEVDKFFELGDLYAQEGNFRQAARMYEEGLAVDSWNYAYQIKHAEILLKNKQTEQALEKLKAVCEYAEQEPLIQQARILLKESGEAIPSLDTEKAAEGDKPCLYLIPLGKVNSFLLEEVRQDLERFMGIRYAVLPNNIQLGPVDRSKAVTIAENMVNRIRERADEKAFSQLLDHLNIQPQTLETYKGQKEFVITFLKEYGSVDEYLDFQRQMVLYEKEGQYDAYRMNDLIKTKLPPLSHQQAYGYLGITEEDMYAEDFNFLFGSASTGYGVVSYHRFRAEFNESPQNRPLLRKRTLKQAVSSSFYVLGIPRCTSPMCVRAYPNSLEEHDQKGLELCGPCKKSLEKKLSELAR